MIDFLLTTGIIILLLPIYYYISKSANNTYLTLLFVILMYPTIKALINGAPFVPTPKLAVKKMIKEANIKDGDKIYDIGCGDGRVLNEASKEKKINAIGFELSPLVFLLAIIKKIYWRSKAKIIFGDFKTKNFNNADIIFCYLLPETLAKLEPKLSRELKKGAKVISYAFPIHTWNEKKKIEKDPKNNIGPIWVYEKI